MGNEVIRRVLERYREEMKGDRVKGKVALVHTSETTERPKPKPFLKNGVLVIPFESDPKYHWWAGGQGILETLKELGATEEVIRRYRWVERKMTHQAGGVG